MDCEICGRRPAYGEALIEGAKLMVCKACGKGAQMVAKREVKKESAPMERSEEEEDVVEGWGRRIREARERKGQSVEELAKEIKESAAYLQAIEAERMKPTIKTAKKLEKALGITLIEKYVVSGGSGLEEKSFKEITLEDLLEAQKKEG